MSTPIALWEVALLLFLVAGGSASGIGVLWANSRLSYEHRLALMQREINDLRAEVKMWSEITSRLIRQGGRGGIEIHAGEDVSIGGDAVGRDRASGTGGHSG